MANSDVGGTSRDLYGVRVRVSDWIVVNRIMYVAVFDNDIVLSPDDIFAGIGVNPAGGKVLPGKSSACEGSLARDLRVFDQQTRAVILYGRTRA
jgi:hypothetical protein